MSNIINNKNINEYRENFECNYHDSIKSTVLNLIEVSHEELLESNKFTEDMLDDITYAVRNDEEFNNYLDSLIEDEITECIKDNELEEIE